MCLCVPVRAVLHAEHAANTRTLRARYIYCASYTLAINTTRQRSSRNNTAGYASGETRSAVDLRRPPAALQTRVRGEEKEREPDRRKFARR